MPIHRRAFAVLVVLLLLTAVSLLLDRHAPPGYAPRAAVISLALVKMRLVAFEYMELDRAPVALARAFDVWALILGAVLLWLLAA